MTDSLNHAAPTIGLSAEAGSHVLNLAAYKFAVLENLNGLRSDLKKLCERLELKGTILLSPEGINLFVAGAAESVDELLDRIRQIQGLGDLEGKQSFTSHQPFHRMLVKIKKEIIAFGIDEILPAVRTSPKLPAATLKQWLDEGRPITLLDVRNDYEIELGTFRGAVGLSLKHFRHFPKATQSIPDEKKEETVVMFCTGGIRCEKAGPWMEKIGFKNIFQLEGGILKYFEECGGDHFDGSCFVFDQRVAVGPDLRPTGDAMCFACQATLKPADLESPHYVEGISCPHCFVDRETQLQAACRKRTTRLHAIALAQPGCQPHDNLRSVFVPRKHAGQSLIDFLDQWHPGYGRMRWLEAIERGLMTRDGRRVTAEDRVREGERFEQVEPNKIEPQVACDIQVLMEEEGFIVIDKPAPLPTHASGRFHLNTLESFLAEAYRPQKLRLLHRLDANTSGLMVIARNYRTARLLQPMFEKSQVEKKYLARVHGHPPQDHFSCDAKIGTSPRQLGARSIDENGLSAKTDFQLTARLPDGTSILEVIPRTGRTNQIRLHLAHCGLPIVGDPLYGTGGQIGIKSVLGLNDPPMCLHAMEIQFQHPYRAEQVLVRSARRLDWNP